MDESYESYNTLQGGIRDISRDKIDCVVYEHKKLLDEYTEECKFSIISAIEGLIDRDAQLFRACF